MCDQNDTCTSQGTKDDWQPPEAQRNMEGVSLRTIREIVVLPIPLFWTFNLQNCESIHFYSFKPVFGICYSSLRKLIQSLKSNAIITIIYWLFTMYVSCVNTLLYFYGLNQPLQKLCKDEKIEASIGHCKRAFQKFPGKEEPQTSQNQQQGLFKRFSGQTARS